LMSEVLRINCAAISGLFCGIRKDHPQFLAKMLPRAAIITGHD